MANVASSAKWVEKKWLGSGGYGIVTLQEKEGGGQLRAVKKVAREMGKANRSQELKALSKLMDVRIHAIKDLPSLRLTDNPLGSVRKIYSCSSLAGTRTNTLPLLLQSISSMAT